MNLTRLFYLAHIKNAVNKKRRRFYMYRLHYHRNYYMKPTKTITEAYALKMYEAAKVENKSYTKEFTALRRQLNVKSIWSDSGGCNYLILEDGQKIHCKDFKKGHDDYIAETYLLRDGKVK